MEKNKTIIIGIAGASASGKSLLANTIFNELGSDQVVIISEDAYYKDHSDIPFEERAKVNYDHPDAFDHQLLLHHIKELQKGNRIEIPVYNHGNDIIDTNLPGWDILPEGDDCNFDPYSESNGPKFL